MASGTSKSETAVGWPIVRRLILLPATKASALPSGDQNTARAPSVPRIGVSAVSSRRRTKTWRAASPTAITAIARPSGDTAIGTASTDGVKLMPAGRHDRRFDRAPLFAVPVDANGLPGTPRVFGATSPCRAEPPRI